MRTGREVLAEALGAELDLDLTPEFMACVDRILTRLWLEGYAVLPLAEEVR